MSEMAFVSIVDLVVEIEDDEFRKKIGTALRMMGGTKFLLDERSSKCILDANGNAIQYSPDMLKRRLHMRVSDPVYLDFECSISLREAISGLQRLSKERGPREEGILKRCSHSVQVPGCQSCLRKTMYESGVVKSVRRPRMPVGVESRRGSD